MNEAMFSDWAMVYLVIVLLCFWLTRETFTFKEFGWFKIGLVFLWFMSFPLIIVAWVVNDLAKAGHHWNIEDY
jgi:hypothetical protein